MIEANMTYIFNSIESGHASLVQTFENKHLSTNEVQTFVSTQLRDIHSDLRKYSENVVENSRVQESNSSVRHQPSVQEISLSNLNAQTILSHREQIDFIAQSSHLSEEWYRSGAIQRIPGEVLLQLRRDLSNMHRQLEETDGGLQAAVSTIGRKEQLQQSLAKAMTKCQV